MWTLGFLLVITIVIVYEIPSYLSIIGYEKEKEVSTYYKETSIITIATGGYNAHDLVKSLRSTGRWEKNIYIYQDKCTPNEIDTKKIFLNNTKIGLNAKLYKMDILKNTTEKYVLFLDSDIVVKKDIDKFFQSIGVWKEECDAYMPHDIWYSKKFKINGGIIFAKRGKSERFLKLWKENILDKNYRHNKDQPALKRIVEDKLVNICMIDNDKIGYLPDGTGRLRTVRTEIFQHALKYKINKNKC